MSAVTMAAGAPLRWPRTLGTAVLIPLAMLTFGTTRAGAMREAASAIPAPVLIGLHATRVLGVFFLLLYSGGRLPGPVGPVAGCGDLLIGLTACSAGQSNNFAYKPIHYEVIAHG